MKAFRQNPDIKTLIQLIAQTELLCKEPFDHHQYTIASTLGYLYRIYGFDDMNQLIKAEMYFNRCLAYATSEKDIAKEITTRIRLGEVYKYQGNHQKALELFQKAVLLCEASDAKNQLDFAYQHLGKCLMEMGRYNEAQAVLRLALALRKQKDNQDLIDSTIKALTLNNFYIENES
ncbi:tetratricopeptide repeat protein [Solibacillus sp.]|uniref:tetratricopeptide repeat protein n=1 Tax=Solibacillus sp. TaxID=1909654 RepID=UPI003315CE93